MIEYIDVFVNKSTIKEKIFSFILIQIYGLYLFGFFICPIIF